MPMCRTLCAAAIVAVLATTAHSVDVPGLPDQPHIVVTGEGIAEAEPDYLELSLYVALVKPDGPSAKAAVDERSLAVVEALRAVGLEPEHINTGPLTIDIEYDYSSDPIVAMGFQATRNIDVTILDIGKFDAIVEAATKSGATSVASPRVRSRREVELAQQAQDRAVQDARERAASLARGFDLALGPVYGIATSDARHWSPHRFGRGGSIFGSPEDDPNQGALTFTPHPVAVQRTVYVVFLLQR